MIIPSFWERMDEINKMDEEYKDLDLPIAVYFPDFELNTRIKLFSAYMFLSKVYHVVQYPRNPMAFAAILLNILHLMVMTRKTMRAGSVNMILIALALHDISLVVLRLYSEYDYIFFPKKECVRPYHLLRQSIDKLTTTGEMFLKRTSCWLVVLMALVRTLCTVMDDSKISFLMTTKWGIITTLIAISTSSLFTLPVLKFFIFSELSIPEADFVWIPPEECEQYPPGYNITESQLRYPAMLQLRDDVLDGVTINIIPSILYPILTIILVKALRASRETKKRLRQDTSQDRTTHVVIGMTISFLVAEIPQGICYVWNLSDPDMGFVMISFTIKTIFAAISLMNASTHCIICFALSSNYRKTVRAMLRCNRRSNRVLPPLRSLVSLSNTIKSTYEDTKTTSVHHSQK